MLLGKLLQALQEHLGADLVGHVAVEAALDDLARRFAGPEAGDRGVVNQLAVLLVEQLVGLQVNGERQVEGASEVRLGFLGSPSPGQVPAEPPASFMSAPAQNESPAPVTMPIQASSSSRKRSHAAFKSRRSSALMALRASGRL